ncbi:universal stress protein [Pseudarthrobacter sp. NIBRBAC000502770]|uniref:universal stress protein n=1 Tax=Pseudarthrobacter sp. NIBRBAC000502770 TaxID=2590785 RepID=UPI0011404323|nr:universal stress protein [Pseudarthrobacter sp. NIBRBAC000502770]QDG90821.1 universal stress protein [Pseudarthrobacter sp. NIBRBAC000502770]
MQGSDPSSADAWNASSPIGPVVLGVPWRVPHLLVQTAAKFAADLSVHLVCAYIEPSGVLTEWDPYQSRTAASLDPTVNEEAMYPASSVTARLSEILGPPGTHWSFRELRGDISAALSRLADSSDACILVVGNGREGLFAQLNRIIEGPVASRLTRTQNRPVLVVPEHRS